MREATACGERVQERIEINKKLKWDDDDDCDGVRKRSESLGSERRWLDAQRPKEERT